MRRRLPAAAPVESVGIISEKTDPRAPSRAFSLHKRGEGKLHTQALIALAGLIDGRTFQITPPIQAQGA